MNEIIYDHITDEVSDCSQSNSLESIISMMMFSNGDDKAPEHDSVVFLEELLKSELKNLLNISSRRVSEKGRDNAEICNVLWALRNKITLLSRFFRYLKDKEEIFSLDFGNLTGGAEIKLSVYTESLTQLLPECPQFQSVLQGMEQSDEDEEKTQRMERIIDYIRALDPDTYMEFSRARRASICKVSNRSLAEWLGRTDPLKMEIIIVFNFLASEVVAEMVENAFKCKVEEEAVSLKVSGPQIGLKFYKMALRRNRGHKATGYLLQ